jgi:signal transduction histidine kinase
LEAGNLAHDHHRIYSRIRATAKRMNQLLNDLLTLSRAESGKLQFEPEIVNLPNYCHQLIEEIQVSFETVPTISFKSSGDCEKAYIDPQLMRAILTNLLSNAVKYSEDTPRVSLELTCSQHQLIFQIQDQGIGIAPDDQAHLYEAFYRGANVGNIAGTGMGLSVVIACLQLHQGSLTCDSQLGKGTTFKVTLPRID